MSAPRECTNSASDVLHVVAAASSAKGNENDGFLSRERGFLPRANPRTELPSTHALWDELAADLPRLHRTLGLRGALERMPTLAVDPTALADDDLLRAAQLLGLFAHAYHVVETRPPERLPLSVESPWAIVRGRLGRVAPVLTYVDLIANNYALTTPDAAWPYRVEDMRLLVPTVDVPEEHIFYLTQTEILAQLGSSVGAMAEAQDAVARDDEAALRGALSVVHGGLERATFETLPKIDPRRGSPRHVDPVRWAKCVAPLAVPLRDGDLGPSGMASPIFHALDVFLGRELFESALGREILALRRGYPKNWRRYLDALAVPSVARWVEAHGALETRALFAEVQRAYAGRGGFLERHRVKVAGYLEIAFKVGRDVTIGGFRGPFASRTWSTVDDALEASRRERPPHDVAEPPSPAPASGRVVRGVRMSEIAHRNDALHGFWLLVDGNVYDVTSFVASHPGGVHPIVAHAGTDATSTFRRIHSESPRARAMLARCFLGTAAPVEDARTRAYVALMFLVVEMQNALRANHVLQTMPCSGGEPARPRSPWRLARAAEGHERFAATYLGVLVGERIPALLDALPELADLREQVQSFDAMLSEASSARVELERTVEAARGDASFLEHASRTAAFLEAKDTRVLDEWKVIVTAFVGGLETAHRGPTLREEFRVLTELLASTARWSLWPAPDKTSRYAKAPLVE